MLIKEFQAGQCTVNMNMLLVDKVCSADTVSKLPQTFEDY